MSHEIGHLYMQHHIKAVLMYVRPPPGEKKNTRSTNLKDREFWRCSQSRYKPKNTHMYIEINQIIFNTISYFTHIFPG